MYGQGHARESYTLELRYHWYVYNLSLISLTIYALWDITQSLFTGFVTPTTLESRCLLAVRHWFNWIKCLIVCSPHNWSFVLFGIGSIGKKIIGLKKSVSELHVQQNNYAANMYVFCSIFFVSSDFPMNSDVKMTFRAVILTGRWRECVSIRSCAL